MVRHSREAWKTYKNVFDSFTEQNLIKLQGQGHFDELLSPITLGKEANVFTASKGDEKIIVKIYRTMNCNFNKMHEYLISDERYHDIKNHKRKIIFAWVQREFANLHLAREHIRVPTPYTYKDSIIIMDLIGQDGVPAPMLKDKPPKNPQKFYDTCIENMERMKAGGLVHGDLSAFNILNDNEVPVFIDFSQATTTKSPGSQALYDRDLVNLNTFFEKHGVKTRT